MLFIFLYIVYSTLTKHRLIQYVVILSLSISLKQDILDPASPNFITSTLMFSAQT